MAPLVAGQMPVVVVSLRRRIHAQRGGAPHASPPPVVSSLSFGASSSPPSRALGPDYQLRPVPSHPPRHHHLPTICPPVVEILIHCPLGRFRAALLLRCPKRSRGANKLTKKDRRAKIRKKKETKKRPHFFFGKTIFHVGTNEASWNPRGTRNWVSFEAP